MFMTNCTPASRLTRGQNPQIYYERTATLILGMPPWENRVVCIDHILLSPSLIHAVKKIEHVNYGRRVSDHSAVVMTLDWAQTDKGQGVFRCGAETHKNIQYQDIIFCSFYKSVLDYVEDSIVQNNLRGQVDKILTLTLNRNKIMNDVELDPIMKEGTLFVMEDNIRNLKNLLPKLEELITAFIPGKAMPTLVFLFQKAS